MKPLTLEEIEEARKATADTAMDLLGAAETLLKAGYRAPSFFLSHAAVEEISKVAILVGVGLEIVAGRAIDWKEVGSRLESHREKIQQAWIGLHINADEKIADPDLLAKAREWFAAGGPAKARREHALYAGVVNVPGRPMAFKKPAEVIDQTMAMEALAIATQIVTDRVQDEEISRGHLAQMPPGLIEAVERHVEALMESRRKASDSEGR